MRGVADGGEEAERADAGRKRGEQGGEVVGERGEDGDGAAFEEVEVNGYHEDEGDVEKGGAGDYSRRRIGCR